MSRQSNTPTVAVIIPFYNGSAWIERALASVMRQTIKAAEVIVVNDGSRVDEREALGALQSQYDFLIIDKENGGQSSARNLGVERSSSDLISFLDQDDFYPDKHIEWLLKAIPEKPFREWAFVYGDVSIADESGHISQKYFHEETQPYRHPLHGTVQEILGSGDMFILPSATLISRKTFLSVGGFDTQFIGYEDDDLFLRFMRADCSYSYTPYPVLIWCQRPTSTSYTVHMSRSRLHYLKRVIGFYGHPGAEIWRFGQTPYDGVVATRARINDEVGDFLPKYMIPRFGHVFYREAFAAKQDRSEKFSELFGIFSEYVDLVISDPTVPSATKSEVLGQLKELGG